MTRLSVCVFCSASQEIPRRYLRLAAQVGAGIAERGWDLVSGGEHVSMMGAVATAARAGGARTLGVVPRFLLLRADPESDELVVTESMGERKARMMAHAHALLALPGGLGTCEELFEAWIGRLVGAHAKPIVLLDVDGHFSGLLTWLGEVRDRGFASQSALAALTLAGNVTEALDACVRAHRPPAWRPGPRSSRSRHDPRPHDPRRHEPRPHDPRPHDPHRHEPRWHEPRRHEPRRHVDTSGPGLSRGGERVPEPDRCPPPSRLNTREQ